MRFISIGEYRHGISVELTEQAAITNLASAQQMIVRDIGLVILLAFTPAPPAQAPTANAQIQGRPSG